MPKVTVTFIDEENGHVKMDCDPSMQQLVEVYKRGDATPAMQYAVLAIGKVLADSQAIDEEQRRDARLIVPGSGKFSIH